MMTRLARIGLAAAFSAAQVMMAADSISKTEPLDLPLAGVLHLKHSTGEVTIIGWDRKDAEITTTKYAKKPGIPQSELDRLRITPERHGDELVITTVLPKHRRPLHPFTGISDFEIDCVIRVPRNTRLRIQHEAGPVNIDGITGDMTVKDFQGQILVRLPQEGTYDIDAKATIGNVESDFDGRERGHIGHAFLNQAGQGAQKLHLRLGYGDITIMKIHIPPMPKPLER